MFEEKCVEVGVGGGLRWELKVLGRAKLTSHIQQIYSGLVVALNYYDTPEYRRLRRSKSLYSPLKALNFLSDVGYFKTS